MTPTLPVDEPIGTLIPHPRNPRRGDVAAIVQSIQHNGWWGAVVAQTTTRHVLVGNHRLLAAKRAGHATIPTYWLDVPDDVALRVLLADNRAADLATYDDAALLALLEHVAAADDLAATLYTDADLDRLRASLEPDTLAGFALVDDDLATDHACPECGYEWSGNPRPGAPTEDDA